MTQNCPMKEESSYNSKFDTELSFTILKNTIENNLLADREYSIAF